LVMMWPTAASGARPSSSEAASTALRSRLTRAVSPLSCAALARGAGLTAPAGGAARLSLATSAGRSARGGTRSASRTGRRPSRLGVLLRAGQAHPFAAVGVPRQVQEPLQKACTIAPAKPRVTALCASAAANSLGDAWPRRSASAMTWATAARCGPADCLIRDRDSHLTAVFADRTDLVLSVVARRVSSQPITGAEYCAAEY
jgi:hypothetical protein